MGDSEFWKNLAAQFRALNCHGIRLTWSVSETGASEFASHLDADRGVTVHAVLAALQALFAEVGLKVDPRSDNPINSWCIALSKQLPDDARAIEDPGVSSAVLCSRLQMEAMRDEQQAKATQLSETRVAKPISVADQLEPLRIEADVSQEKLADLVDIDIRNVQRHLSGVTKPTKRNIFRYQREFSKLLKRDIVINRTP
jgi:DNA-binding transcriptional regulator YiaG